MRFQKRGAHPSPSREFERMPVVEPGQAIHRLARRAFFCGWTAGIGNGLALAFLIWLFFFQGAAL